MKFLLLIKLSATSIILIESRRQQPQQPSSSKTFINHNNNKPRGLYYSPISRGGGISTNEQDYYSTFGIYSTSSYNKNSINNNKTNNHKIKSVAWTPETIKRHLLIYDDITALEEEQDDDDDDYYEQIIINQDRRNTNKVKHFISNNNIILKNRVSNRITKCRVLINHYATDHSIGSKIYNDMKCKLLLHRNNDIPKTKDTVSNGILEEEERNALLKQVDTLLLSVSKALEDDTIWNKLLEKDGVSIWRSNVDVKNYSTETSTSACISTSTSTEADYATIRSEAIMTASPKEVYELFMDNDRVHEYNDNCKELKDIEHISSNAKISWSATPKMGPFAARDFVTLVTFQPLHGDNSSMQVQQSYVSLAVHIDHPKLAPPTDGYVRSQIQLAATFMHAIPGRPDLTRLVQVTQVGELGGVADSPIARRITSNLAEKAPVEFMKKFNNAVNRPLERKEA